MRVQVMNAILVSASLVLGGCSSDKIDGKLEVNGKPYDLKHCSGMELDMGGAKARNVTLVSNAGWSLLLGASGDAVSVSLHHVDKPEAQSVFEDCAKVSIKVDGKMTTGTLKADCKKDDKQLVADVSFTCKGS